MKYIKIDEINNNKEIYSLLDDEGKMIDSSHKVRMSKEIIKKSYEYMVLSRQQDTYMSQLQRQGRMLTFAPNFGEEGLQVAVAASMTKDDWFVPAFRSNATMLQLGVPLINQITYWNGNEWGSHMPEGVNVLPINVPIATQCSHAAGIAYGMKLNGEKNAVVTFIGNGGTAEGEFYEAMNIASIHKWPIIFCVNNNQFSISTRNNLETGEENIAAKGLAVKVPGIRVDGNDVLASYEVMEDAIEKVKNGSGPILVEFITWREGVHTSSDNPRIYRTKEEEDEAFKKEPFHRIEKYMFDNKIMTEDEKAKIWEEKLNEVKDAYQESLKNIDSKIEDVFDHTYAELPAELKEQKEEIIKYYETIEGSK